MKKKLNKKQVKEIKELYFKGNETQKVIAQKYKVSKSCINSLLAEKTYHNENTY